jgi:hypothetical protein
VIVIPWRAKREPGISRLLPMNLSRFRISPLRGLSGMTWMD